MDTNVLYYGDNSDILRRPLPDAAVDLVYLDPPFNSNATTTSSSATSRAGSNHRCSSFAGQRRSSSPRVC
jgi:16S rRNA G966 N2-methylase RsmD